ncbi:glycoside hydrolase family 3 protein [Spirochaeta cellobiosiphila]|uniref:glycoside hydrolase family 3 protein n=1 Tax=Spirochaeta cellobiosiphila TaxID=504483 RepID=UPI0003F708CA|nr:glycoside hydrolase family 3 protein [Spirochaeta cellobiosiphila]
MNQIIITSLVITLLLSALLLWKSRKRVKLFTVFLLLTILVVGIHIGTIRYSNVIDIYFTKMDEDAPVTKEARAKAKEMTEDVQAEGIVLLKNEDDLLPMTSQKVNLFGYTSINITYGGSGSGAGDEKKNVSLIKALEDQGYEANPSLISFYQQHIQEKQKTNVFHLIGGDYNNYEPEASQFSDTLIQEAKDYSDVAFVVFTRNGGEGGDLPYDTADYTGGAQGQHYLELTNNERSMLDIVKKNFNKIVVLINSSNAMELGFLDDPKIKAALWIGGPGSTGTISVAKVLDGEINPSGALADTYAYELESAPAYYNFGDFQYLNTNNIYDAMYVDLDHYSYVDYIEGIYVGYRFYETRFVDNRTNRMDEEAYHKLVQYPFGYGLSYTDFTQSIEGLHESGDHYELTVKVTNIGNVPGKDVVQVYVTAPYTIGGIEKPFVSLLDFDKTKMLQPGERETLTISFAKEDLASYDYITDRAYVLDKGTYEIKLMDNAHDLIESRKLNIPEKVVYNENNKRPSDQVAAVNHFDDVSFANNNQYVTRADWEGTLPTVRPEPKDATPEMVRKIEDDSVEQGTALKSYKPENNHLVLNDLKGVPYDDPKWSQLIKQIPVQELVTLLGYGGFATASVPSIEKYKTSDLDGPAGINGLVNGASGNHYTSAVVVSSTWNKELVQKLGETVGTEARAYGVSGLYGPAMNIHRTPFGGRNFEYYSEDGVLAGKIAAAFIKGARSQGIYPYIKHFAMNPQEVNRLGMSSWATEQSMREVYFKPFELAVKEGVATAVMAADVRLGLTWTGQNKALLQNVLRSEWGFKGFVISDYVVDNYKNPDIAVRMGTDMMLTSTGATVSKATTQDTRGIEAMQEAAHHILYTISNSDAQEISVPQFPFWIFILIALDMVLVGTFALFLFLRKPE